jgi:hypothetical protein
MAKKKIKIWKYILFGLIAGGLYAFFYFNGLNLISEYSKEIGALGMLAITKLAAKWFGWNLSFLLKEETAEKAGEAVKNAEKKGVREGRKIGKKIAGRIRVKWAAKKLQEETGCGKLKALFITQEVYRKMKKKNPELFGKEKK